MRTSTEAATAAPQHITIKGKQWTFSPLRKGEWGEYLSFLKGKYIDDQVENAKKLPDDLREKIIKDAFVRMGTFGLSSPEMRAQADNFDCAIQLMLLSLRRAHPDVTEDDVQQMIMDDTWKTRILDKVALANNYGEHADPKAPVTTEKKRRKRRRRRR